MVASQEIKNGQFGEWMSKIRYAENFYSNISLAKKRFSYYRWKITEELDKQLLEYESSVKRTGGSVLWADDANEALTVISPLCELSDRVAFLPSRMANELHLSSKKNIPALSHYQQKNDGQFPDNLFVQAKFLVSTSGHIYYAASSKEEFEAVNNAKNLIFIAGIESLITNGYELELAKNLYSIYETGHFGYPFEMLTKPGKPENKFVQNVHLVVLDNGRSNLLLNEKFRKFFPLLNFELPAPVAKVFWPEAEEMNLRFGILQESLITPLMSESEGTRSFFFDHPIYNRVSDFLPYELNIYDTFMRAREKYADSIKNNLVRKIFKQDHSKYFLKEQSKLNPKKFALIMKDLLTGNFKQPEMPEKTFVEAHFYNKRKI